MAKMSELGIADFKELINADEKSVVLFYSEWVAQCRFMKNIFESVAEEIKDARFGMVEVGALKELFVIYDVAAVPMTLIFRKGEPLKKIEGYQPKSDLIQEINSI